MNKDKKTRHKECPTCICHLPRIGKCNKLCGEGVTASFCHYDLPCPVHNKK